MSQCQDAARLPPSSRWHRDEDLVDVVKRHQPREVTDHSEDPSPGDRQRPHSSCVVDVPDELHTGFGVPPDLSADPRPCISGSDEHDPGRYPDPWPQSLPGALLCDEASEHPCAGHPEECQHAFDQRHRPGEADPLTVEED